MTYPFNTPSYLTTIVGTKKGKHTQNSKLSKQNRNTSISRNIKINQSINYNQSIDRSFIAGPVHNIMINGQEVTRALVCATELAINHSTTKMDLKTRPIMNVAKDFQVRSYWNIIDI